KGAGDSENPCLQECCSRRHGPETRPQKALMATPPTTPDQGGAPQGGGGAASGGVPPGGQQANPLQSALAQLAKLTEQMANQNPLVQSELMEARSAFVKALQKTMTAARPEQPQPGAPQGQ